MSSEGNNQEIVELQLASKADINPKQIINEGEFVYQQNNWQIFKNSSSINLKPNNIYVFNNETTKDPKTLEMSQFSLIIQEGLQKARKQSQQQTTRNELVSHYTHNMELIFAQTAEMEKLTKIKLLQIQEEQIHMKASELLSNYRKIKDKIFQVGISHQKKGRVLSPTAFFLNSKKKNEKQYFNINKYIEKRNPIKDMEEKTKRRSNLTRRSQSGHKKARKSFDKFDSVRTKETINKQKELLLNRIAIIKESILMTVSSNKNKQDKLKCENKLLRDEIKITDNELYDYHKRSDGKGNVNSKNLKQIANARKKSLKLRKQSLIARQKTQSNSHSNHSLSKKKQRILSSYKEVCVKREFVKPVTVRDEYFDKEKINKPFNEEIQMHQTTEYF